MPTTDVGGFPFSLIHPLTRKLSPPDAVPEVWRRKLLVSGGRILLRRKTFYEGDPARGGSDEEAPPTLPSFAP